MHMSTFPDADRGMLRGDALVFCDPRSPWQRGTRESTNGLPRPLLGGPQRRRSTAERSPSTNLPMDETM